MFTYAEQKLQRLPISMERLLAEIRSYEDTIAKEGRKHFLLYMPDPVNYWEVYARLVMSAILHARIKFLVPAYEMPRLQK
jgi:hypothetical protein